MPRRKKVKSIIDTNLFISFLIGKRLKGLKKLIIDSKVELIFSEQNITELKIVTKRPKLQKYFDPEEVENLIDFIFNIGLIYKITIEPQLSRDPKDNFLLGLADKSKADYLVTGDKDLLVIKKYKNTKIITIEEFEKVLIYGTKA